MSELGTQIQQARKAAGLTQARLAEMGPWSQARISEYERGVVVPTLPTLEAIAKLLGKSVYVALLMVMACGCGPLAEGYDEEPIIVDTCPPFHVELLAAELTLAHLNAAERFRGHQHPQQDTGRVPDEACRNR